MSNGKERSLANSTRRKNKTVHARFCEAHESTRERIQEAQNADHEAHIAETVYNSMTHENLVQKPVPMLKAMKIPDANFAVDKEWDQLQNMPAWARIKS